MLIVSDVQLVSSKVLIDPDGIGEVIKSNLETWNDYDRQI